MFVRLSAKCNFSAVCGPMWLKLGGWWRWVVAALPSGGAHFDHQVVLLENKKGCFVAVCGTIWWVMEVGQANRQLLAPYTNEE